MILCISYLIYDIWYLIFDFDNYISYWISDTLLLYLDTWTISLPFVTCWLLLIIWYLLEHVFVFYPFIWYLLLLAKGWSFRSCSVAWSCLFLFWSAFRLGYLCSCCTSRRFAILIVRYNRRLKFCTLTFVTNIIN